MLKKLTGLVAGIGAAALMGTTAMAQQGVTDDEIILGAHSPLSGAVAVWGVPSTQAMRLYFDQINEAGGIHGRKIKFIVEDSQYQVPRAVQAANKLINRDKIFAMVGALGTPMNNAVWKLQERKNIPNMYPFTAARSMAEPLHPLKFAALGSYYDQTRAAVKYFVEEKGVKTVCTAFQDTDFGQEILEATEDQLKDLGMEVAAKVPHKPTESEFVASVTALRNANCELITMGTIVADTIKLYATARGMGWADSTFVGTTASFDDLIAIMAKGATEGYYAATSFPLLYKDTATGEAKKFFDDYEAAYGKAPGGAAQLGHNSARLVVEALQKAGPDLTTDSFIKATESINGFKDVFGGGDISFSADNHTGRSDIILAQIQNGRWATVIEDMTK